MSSGAAEAAGPAEPNGQGHSDSAGGEFECNICLDTAQDAVVSLCGHLFCWACLHRWMETSQGNKCPVCKAGITSENIIPLYGRGKSSSDDPRQKLPPRPSGQRPEPQNTNNGFFNGLDGFHVSFGIGSFPFGFYGWGAGYGNQPAQHPADPVRQRQESELSRIFMFFGFLCLAWLLMGS